MNTSTKIVSLSEVLALSEAWKRKGERIIFTNGCFDVLHVGHIALLEAARRAGDRLIVGLNSNFSISLLKGPHRPIHPFKDRSRLLAALESVDAIVGFEEETPQRLISQLLPHILVKGGDYKVEEVAGSEIVQKNGGTVLIIPLLFGYSSSGSIEKIQKKRHRLRKET